MAAKILSLYVRAGTGAVRLALKLTERAVTLAGSAIGLSGRDGAPAPEAGPWMESSGAAPEAQPGAGEPEPRQAAAEALSSPPAPAVREPVVDYEAEPATPLDPAMELAKTVDDEPELVDELAEPGAEDGAGATVDVEEPWEGYAQMNADAVIARLREASAAELALVELYERSHKRRQTVLAAAERRHRDITGPAPS